MFQSGLRLKAMQNITTEYSNKRVGRKLQAIGQVTHMGIPALNENGTFTAGIDDEGGLSARWVAQTFLIKSCGEEKEMGNYWNNYSNHLNRSKL